MNDRSGTAILAVMAHLRDACATSIASEGVDDTESCEAAEIAVARKQFRDAVLKTQGGYVSVVNQVARRARLSNDLIEKGRMAFCLGEKYQGRRIEDAAQITERDVQRNGWMKNAGMRHDSKELVNAGPGYRPGKGSFGQGPDQLKGGAVPDVGFDFGVNQDIGIDSLHASPAIHQIEQRVAIEKINSGQFPRLPALEAQFVSRAWGRRQRPAQQVIGHSLKSPPLVCCFFLQSAQKSVVNRQGGSLHVQKHMAEASRCQPPTELNTRTKAFGIRVIKLIDALPRTLAGQVIGRQLLRAATSVGANYRAACRAQSRAEFAAKLSIALEEADESLYWLELVRDTNLVKAERLSAVINEASELVAIMLASRRTAKNQVVLANRESTIENRKSSREVTQ